MITCRVIKRNIVGSGFVCVNSARAFSSAALGESGQFNLLLFGAPGVGKGTYGKLVQRDFDIKAFSTGDYFREIIRKSKEQLALKEIGVAKTGTIELDPFSQKISEILNSGKLIDDEVVVDIIRDLKSNPMTFMDGKFAKSAGLILDGVPRTVK